MIQENNKINPDAQSLQMAVSGSVILPTDLRSGNTIKYFISTDDLGWLPTVVDWQDIRLCHEQNESFNLEHRKIPITEKVLLENNFKWSEGFKKLKHNDFPISFIQHPNGKKDCLVCFLNGFSLGNIKFLNELENLCHSLAG
nr:hypothetical protein [uncultured Flavobacterium sp.]